MHPPGSLSAGYHCKFGAWIHMTPSPSVQFHLIHTRLLLFVPFHGTKSHWVSALLCHEPGLLPPQGPRLCPQRTSSQIWSLGGSRWAWLLRRISKILCVSCVHCIMSSCRYTPLPLSQVPWEGVSAVHCQIHPRVHRCTPLLQVSYRIFPSSALWNYMGPPITCQVKFSMGTLASQYNVHSILLIKKSLNIKINLRNLERCQAIVGIRV